MAEVIEDHSRAWLPKAEAAELLGVSLRQLERRHSEGVVAKRVLPKAKGETASRVVYSRADIEALKAGAPRLPSQDGWPLLFGERRIAPTDGPQAANLQPSSANMVAGLAQVLESLRTTQAASAVSRPWLTLEEASGYSGLPATFLLRQARAGVPWAVNVGSDKSVRWRFNRDALARPIAPAASPYRCWGHRSELPPSCLELFGLVGTRLCSKVSHLPRCAARSQPWTLETLGPCVL
jgi:hypothetical protein